MKTITLVLSILLCVTGCNRDNQEKSKQASQQKSEEARQRAFYIDATNAYNKNDITQAAAAYHSAANVDPTTALGRHALSKAMEMDKMQKAMDDKTVRDAVRGAFKEDE